LLTGRPVPWILHSNLLPTYALGYFLTSFYEPTGLIFRILTFFPVLTEYLFDFSGKSLDSSSTFKSHSNNPLFVLFIQHTESIFRAYALFGAMDAYANGTGMSVTDKALVSHNALGHILVGSLSITSGGILYKTFVDQGALGFPGA
jgi:hypothetical protein